MKNIKTILFFILIATGFEVFAQKFSRAEFYQAMNAHDLNKVNELLTDVQAAPAKDRDAFEGFLLMVKAGLVKKPKEKLQYFKSGRIKFQTAFNADSSNAEFHFLRLAIQEHAPKIIKYRDNLNADRDYLKAHFKSLPLATQQAVIDYSKSSKILRPEDF
ncbi:hypothetical protein MUY27_00445 [Mucilaginibacter sp. RS28]|uniref:Uncharacterized protein n=1 Tax=Mucilaginibacter straminoryzae TaxID=2932774 RepID=A0A9X1X235_9SPHI|nr:hypothetical protein [Mucilaginibacter straminoryzae]MCJ8208153.1 hypothetical protein [Mucilaginibacter straminoryzae]